MWAFALCVCVLSIRDFQWKNFFLFNYYRLFFDENASVFKGWNGKWRKGWLSSYDVEKILKRSEVCVRVCGWVVEREGGRERDEKLVGWLVVCSVGLFSLVGCWKFWLRKMISVENILMKFKLEKRYNVVI